MVRNRDVYVRTPQCCVKFGLLSVCTCDMGWFGLVFSPPGPFFHADPLSLQCDKPSVFSSLAILHGQTALPRQYSDYPTTPMVLPLGSPDFVPAWLALTRTPALSVLDVLLHPSDSLSQQLKSFIPAEENGSIYPETSHQHP